MEIIRIQQDNKVIYSFNKYLVNPERWKSQFLVDIWELGQDVSPEISGLALNNSVTGMNFLKFFREIVFKRRKTS